MSRLLVLLVLFTVSVATFADFFKGVGCFDKKDYVCALKEWTSAADQGVASAQLNLGFMYAKGEGVKQDMVEAKRLYGLACDNRDVKGCKYYKDLNEAGY